MYIYIVHVYIFVGGKVGMLLLLKVNLEDFTGAALQRALKKVEPGPSSC